MTSTPAAEAAMSAEQFAGWLVRLAITLEDPIVGDDPTTYPKALRLAAARIEALGKYARHLDDCEKAINYYAQKCTCGFVS